MGSCKDCLFWDQNWTRVYRPKKQTITNYGVCRHVNTSGLVGDVLTDQDSFGLESGSLRAWGTSLMTGPDFGCSAFKEKSNVD